MVDTAPGGRELGDGAAYSHCHVLRYIALRGYGATAFAFALVEKPGAVGRDGGTLGSEERSVPGM